MGPKNIEQIFWSAAQIELPAERVAYLDRACADDVELRRRVEQLLDATGAAADFLELPLLNLATVEERPVRERPGTVLGKYRLMEEIGAGGFGVVFLAEQQEPVRRKVALKVLKAGMDTGDVIARFEAERQALAVMDHPNIAKVLDAGETAAGRPYFVMELVPGAAITEHCDRAGLSIRARLELFVVVCRAVQHAHQRGIIHRDIKPSNVLVTLQDGTPMAKVIDFGIAKAMGQPLTDRPMCTGLAQMIGTPLYMSPEQALSGLDVDTRTDIYALGVLLYELLTGTTPFDSKLLRTATSDEVRRIIQEEEPARPSLRLSSLGEVAATVAANRRSDPKRLRRLLHGELDWVVMKAMEKDQNRRYETANALASEIERYLQGEPVQACPPSLLYRARKYARRHQAGLAIAGLVLLLLGLLGGIALWAVWDRSVREARAQQEAQRTLDQAVALQGEGKWLEALEEVRRAEGALAGSGGHELLRHVEELHRDLEMVLRVEAIRLPDLVGGPEGDQDYVATDASMAQAFRDYGIDVESLPPAEVGERIRSRRTHRELIVALDHWVKVRTSMAEINRKPREPLLAAARAADPDEWRNHLRIAVEQHQTATLTKLAASARLSELPLQSLSLLGWALDHAGECEQAVAVLRPAQQKYPNDFMINFQLAWSLDHGRQPPPHEQVQDEVIRFYTVARSLRPRNIPVHTVLGHALCNRGKLDEGIAVYRKAIELNPEEAVNHSWLAMAQLAAGDQTGYDSTCSAMLHQFQGTDKPYIAHRVAWTVVVARHCVADAERVVSMAQIAVRSDPGVARFSTSLGAALYRAGRFREAIQRLNQANDAARRQAASTTVPSQAATWCFLAMAHFQLGQNQEARQWLQKGTGWTEPGPSTDARHWANRVTLRALRQEAEELLLRRGN
jgi:serine/threonine protein kinase/tetratricopeptide (TPR) repeat protein